MELAEQCELFKTRVADLKAAIAEVIVGHETVVEEVLITLLAGGHVLLEGPPGLGKTLLARTVAEAVQVPFSRIQFSPDLMPADIVGTNILVMGENGVKAFEFQRGPIFGSVVLADEINRATPKTQSALLEAMEEQTVTVSGTTYRLPDPFIVIATQNPIEMEGTYPLPEAQLDRFFFKILLEPSSLKELTQIVNRTCGEEPTRPRPVLQSEELIALKKLARQVTLAPHINEYAARLVVATHPGSQYATDAASRFIRYGSSPRGAQALILGAKVVALADERYNVSVDDIRRVMLPTLRHRIILNFQGEAEGIGSDEILTEIGQKVPVE